MMRVVRSVLVFLWIALSVVPAGLVLVLLSPFVTSDRLWWGIAVPWLRAAIGAVRLVGGVRYRIHGWEHLPGVDDNRRVVLCAKHQSTWETFFFPAIMPHPLAFVFKRELLRIPVFGWALGRLEMIHIDRSRRSEAWNKVARQGRELMDRGKWVIMFPEGTRTERGKQGVYKSGATRLACATGAEVVPIAVTSGRCWPRRSFWFLPGVIDVSIGPPLDPAGREPEPLMRDLEAWIEGEMRRLDPEAYPAA
ncbi:MAG TPA: lysophospholipid acyltransferase family protein [Pseudohaliea sp.]|nr:lysophospholipid acyltransferase family protein [Pseudohaliea sp.]